MSDSLDVRAIRRVVTGVDKTGRSLVVRQGAPERVIAAPHVDGEGTAWWTAFLWSDDGVPAIPWDVELPDPVSTFATHFPNAGGCRVVMTTIAPGARMDDPEQLALYGGALAEAGISLGAEFGEGGEHQTATLDFLTVLDGEFWLLIGDEEIPLTRGDIVVQTGAEHAWTNRSDKPCTVLVVVIGAEPSP